MTRNDLILIGVLIIFSLIPLVPSSQFLAPNYAMIKVDGVIIRKLDLSIDEIFTLETSCGKNIVEIKNGAVSVIAADCPDKICIERGAIKNVGETIACVPHKVLIEIVGQLLHERELAARFSSAAFGWLTSALQVVLQH